MIMLETIQKISDWKLWKKILLGIVVLVCLPLIIIGVGAYFLWSYRKDVSDTAVSQKDKNLNERIKRAEEKDKELTGKEDALRVEKETLQAELKNNEERHEAYVKRIDNASSIDELRALARELRERRDSKGPKPA
jgi:flagellar basal body-associated protein FliL